jgi:hypothetical protein
VTKRFALDPSKFRALAEGRGSCVASDRITVAGQQVGFMYRELPDNDIDSGWRFFSGEETQEFADDPANFALYDVNTIANCDPDTSNTSMHRLSPRSSGTLKRKNSSR